MRCPFCKEDRDRVIDTRPSDDGYVTRRRRECLACGRRYTTHERLEEIPLRVIKKNNTRAPFDIEKIRRGVERAVEKRPVSAEQIEQLVNAIEGEILERAEREITSIEIGEMLMTKLRALDEVAYVRFASVYREFKAVDEFVREINSISEKGGKHVEN